MTHAAWVWMLAGLVVLGVAPPPAGAQSGPAGTLVVGLVAEPVNLDPAQVTDLNSTRVGRRIVETLVTFPEESTQVVPGLAESWTVARDGLTYAVTSEGAHTVDDTLDALERRLRPLFVRCSRADLVAVDRIDQLRAAGDGSAVVTLADGTPLRVSRRRAADVWNAVQR